MKLILGLGNPGTEYEKTRHNMGFIVLDAFATRNKLSWKNFSKAECLIAQGNTFILAKPQTYMNDSGRAATKMLLYYKIPPAEIWLIHDDIDLPLGMIRVQPKGGTGSTHKGLVSVIQHLNYYAFERFRCGIAGASFRAHTIPSEEYVIKEFSHDELPLVERIGQKTADSIELALARGIEKVQSQLIS